MMQSVMCCFLSVISYVLVFYRVYIPHLSIIAAYYHHTVVYRHHTLVASVWNQRINVVKRINKET